MSSNASQVKGSAPCAWKTLRLVEFAECSFPSELLRLVLAVSGAPHETAAEHVEKEDFYRATVRMLCLCLPVRLHILYVYQRRHLH